MTAGRMTFFLEQCRVQTVKVMNMAEPLRSQRVQELVASHAEMAKARMWEVKIDYKNNPDLQEMIKIFAVNFGRTNFWTLLDVRDAAQADEKGLLADFEGSHAVFINDDQNIVNLPSQALVAVWFPDVITWKRPVQGMETLVSINRARELIDFEVMYPYRPQ